MLSRLISRLKIGSEIYKANSLTQYARVSSSASSNRCHYDKATVNIKSPASLQQHTLPKLPFHADISSKPFSTSAFIQLEETSNTPSDMMTEVNTSLSETTTGRLFAVIHACGKQRKVTSEDIVVLDKHIEADIGERIVLNKVLLVGSRDFTVIGRPMLRFGSYVAAAACAS